MSGRPITFLSDYGYEDEFAGVCRAAIAAIAPEARVIDIGHGVKPGDVRGGAVMLLDAVPHCPAGVHLAIVDPGVGTARRPVAARADADDRLLVGPDNGLLWPALESLGGAVEAVDLTRETAAVTFHGRDLFAPAAARLALGAVLADVGEAIDPGSLQRLELPRPTIEADRLVAEVVRVDRFGNVSLAAGGAEIDSDRFVVEAGGASTAASRARTFADVADGEMIVYADSSGRLALAINLGSAAEALGVGPGDEVVLRPKR